MRRVCVGLIVGLAVSSLLLAASTARAVDRDLRKLAKSGDSGERFDAVWLLVKEPLDAEAQSLFAELLVDDGPVVRDNAVVAAGRFQSDDAVEKMARKAKARRSIDRENVAMALARTERPAALPTLEKLALGDKDADVRRTAAWELARFENSEAAFGVARQALSDEDARVRVAALRALRFNGQVAARPFVEAALTDGDDRVRHMALIQMSAYGVDAATPHMIRMAQDPSHRVRSAAATLAWSFRNRDALDVLVPMVADEREHVAALAHRTLRLLTRKGLDRDPEVWTAWWAGARESWRLPRNIESKWFWDDRYASPAAIYGARLTSDALVLVLDISSALERTATGESTRWDEIRDHVAEAVEELPDGTLLNVVTMNDDVDSVFPEPRALDERTRKRVLRFLEAAKPGGGCDLWGGLSTAFAQHGIDTVVVVASETRNRGEVRHKTLIRARAQREYFTNALVVHTVRIPKDETDAPDVLNELAEDTLGRARKKVF